MLENKSIILITCGHFDKSITTSIANDIQQLFHYPVLVRECSFDIANFYDAGRRQYDANQVMKLVSERVPYYTFKAIGVFRVDLFIPILTYIFGQAVLNGNIGIASLYRLRNELYGLPPNQLLMIERFRKVVIHELGHTFGLIHCLTTNCIMRSSTYVEDIDQKELRFCPSCQAKLHVKRTEHIL